MEEYVSHLLGDKLEESPLKCTTESLSKTSKGQIMYDRTALSPILPVAENSSGPLLPDKVFRRNAMLLFERSFEESPILRKVQQATNMMSSTNNMLLNLNSTSKWQTELALRRSPVEETTPVYNISHHMIMQLFEAKEKERITSKASSFKKKMEDFELSSRQAAEEECHRMKKELEQRLVPTETGFDLDQSMQRLQEEAQMQRKLQADQIERRLRDIQSQQEREQQMIKDDLRRKMLEQQTAEARRRKETCSERVQSCWRKYNESLSSCLATESLSPAVHSKMSQIKAIKSMFESSLPVVDAADPLSSAVQSETTTRQLEELIASICSDIEKHNSAVQQHQREAAVAVKKEEAAVPAPSRLEPEAKPQEGVTVKEAKPSGSALDFVHEEDFAFYTKLLAELKECEANTVAITTDPTLKTLRFDLQKAVVSPVNEISDQSAQHLQEKLDRLRNLLLGNPVDVGQKRVRATQHPAGVAYCTNLLARKLVQQGEDQVNVNPKAAFPIAAIITELWLEFPAFGRLLLAHFYKQCPYLVPYYVPQQEGQSDEDYYRSLGYKYTNGRVEQQPAYLKRMSGVVRLYAAVMTSTPRRNQPHPYGLDQAWRYLAALVNLRPRSDVTAGILEVFLSVVGHAMTRQYGKQFQKILHLICTDYFAMIHSVTPPGSGGGPAFRLENFLHDSIKAGGIPPPVGQLPARFW